MPPTAPIDPDALGAFLMSDRAPEGSMGLSDLDGFLAGIAVGPELLPPSGWLPVIWSGAEPGFGSVKEARDILGTIMGRQDGVIRRFNTAPDGFDPVFREGHGGQAVIMDRTAGILDAVELRPEA